MTQIFTGTGLGLRGSSIDQLGGYGPKGASGLGQGGVGLSVNAANGNVLLQQTDGFLANTGVGFNLAQSYNSQGEGSWQFNTDTRLIFNGAANTVDSTVTRLDEEGHWCLFKYDTSQHMYLATDGRSARLTFDGASWSYREGTGLTSQQYNIDGQLTFIHDTSGHTLEFKYIDGILQSITDNRHKESIVWLFAGGVVSDVIFQSDGVTIHHLHYDYDSHQRLIRISRDMADGTTYWVAYDYDNDSKLITGIRQSDGTCVRMQYDSQNRITRMIDGEGRITTYTYLEGKTIITNGLGESWAYYYDADARLTGIDGPNNLHIRYHYLGKYLDEIIQGNQRWHFLYNNNGDCVRMESPTGEITTRTYDDEHRILTQTHYQGFDVNHAANTPQTTRYLYDSSGLLRFDISASGVVTEYRYDDAGLRISSRCYLNSRITGNASTLADLILWAQNTLQNDISLVEYHYDWRGCLSEEIHYTQVDAAGVGIVTADALRAFSRYDAAGRLLEKSSLTSSGMSTSYYFYDALGRLIKTLDNQNNTQTIEYDDLHQRIIKTAPNGLQTIALYDHSGLLLSTQQLDSTHDYGINTYRYDAAGRVIAETDVLGRSAYTFYDADGRIIGKISSMGCVTEYIYDIEGRCVQTYQYQKTAKFVLNIASMPSFASIKPAISKNDRSSQFIYNQYNQLVYQIDAEGAVTGLDYDGTGKLIEKKLYAQRLDGYDASNILIFSDIAMSSSVDDRISTYYYDADGNLQAEINGVGATTSYRYDALGHLIETIRYATYVANLRTGNWMLDAPPSTAVDIHYYAFYNSAGLKIADINGARYLTEYIYDSQGLLTNSIAYSARIADAMELSKYPSIDALRPLSNAQDHRTIYRYNDLKQCIEEQTSTGLVITYTYDKAGLIIKKNSTDSVSHEERGSLYRYDSQGHLTQSLDALGAAMLAANNDLTPDEINDIWQQHSASYVYNLAGNLISKSNALNETTRYIYNNTGQLIYTLSPQGSITKNCYTAFEQVESSIRYSKYYSNTNSVTLEQLDAFTASIVDARYDEVTHYTYNTLGLLTSVKTGSGKTESMLYTTFGECAQRQVHADKTRDILTNYEYDQQGLLHKITEDVGGLNKLRQWDYDVFGRAVSAWDARLGVVKSFFDNRDNLIRVENQVHEITLYTYDAFSRRIMTTGRDNLNYIYNDVTNTLTLESIGINKRIVTQYTAFGDKLSIIDANLNTTTYAYNAEGQLIGVEAPENSITDYIYDDVGRLIFEEDAGGHIRRYTYDAAGRLLTKQVDPDGLNLTTTYMYDALNRQLKVVDAGRSTTFSYDNEGRLIQTAQDPDGLNLRTLFSYDERGYLLSETRRNPSGLDSITTYTHDALGRCTSRTLDPNGLKITTLYAYDQNDNLISETDANQYTTYFVYAANNQLRYKIDTLGVVTEHCYDARGNETRTTTYATPVQLIYHDADSIISALKPNNTLDQHNFFIFDEQNRLTQKYDHLGYATSYSYDNNNNIIQTLQFAIACDIAQLLQGQTPEQLRSLDERTTYFIYDSLNQLRFKMGARGRLTEYCYDAGGQLIVKTCFANNVNMWALHLDYSLQNMQKCLVMDGLDESTRYAYDDVGRIYAETNALGVVKTYTYDMAGNKIASTQCQTLLNQAQLEDPNWQYFIQFSAADRTMNSIFDAAGRECYRISATGHVVERCYDALGNVIKEIVHASGFVPFKTQSSLGLQHEVVFKYDAIGRLLNKTDALEHATSYTYDANNNVTTKFEANNAPWQYTYNAANQLTQTLAPVTTFKTYNAGSWFDETRSVSTQNTYDSFGNLIRIIKDVGGINQRIEYEYDANNQVTAIIYPDVAVDAATNNATPTREERLQTLKDLTQYNAFGEVIAHGRLGQLRYFIYNQVGQQCYSINAEGALTEYRYDAFDNLTLKIAYALPIAGALYDAKSIESVIQTSKTDRSETYIYNKNNQCIETLQDMERMYDSITQTYLGLRPCMRQTYNAFGEVITHAVQLTSTKWSTTTYDYDNDGLKVSSIDPEYYLTTYSYDVYGNMSSETQFATRCAGSPPAPTATDRTINFVYNANGQLIQKTLKNAAVQRLTGVGSQFETYVRDLSSYYGYDAMGNLVSTTDPTDNTAYTYYDAAGRISAKLGAAMQGARAATTYIYDALGNLVESRQWANGAQAYANETQFSLNNSSTADVVHQDIYDASGNLTQKNDATGYMTFYSYDAMGNIARSWQVLTQAAGAGVLVDKRYTYDRENRLIQTATCASSGTRITDDAQYNAFGNVINKGMNGIYTTRIDYDRSGRVWRSNTQGYFQIYVYDLNTNVTQIVTASNELTMGNNEPGVDLSNSAFDDVLSFDGGSWHYTIQHQFNTYDARGFMVRQTQARLPSDQSKPTSTDPDPVITQQIDRWGNVTAHTGANGYTTRYVYNSLNILTQMTMPEVKVVDAQGVARTLAPVINYAVDALGRVMAMTDANGHTVVHVFDAEGRSVRDVDSRGFYRDKVYNQLGQLTQQINELGVVTTYSYDLDNRLVSVNSPSLLQRYAYNAAGQLIRQIDPQGNVRTMAYDEMGNITEQTDLNGTTYYKYDAAGNKLSEQDAKGNIRRWSYDVNGRIVTHTDFGGHHTDYTYNTNGLIIKEKSNAGKYVTYGYYHTGQLKQYVDFANSEIIDYTYDIADNMKSKCSRHYPDWAIETDYYEYDALGRLIQVRRNSLDVSQVSHDLLSVNYEYDAVGNIRDTQVNLSYIGYQATSHTDYFVYDENDRMIINKGLLVAGQITINSAQGSVVGYDGVGNIISATKYEGGALQQYAYTYNTDNLLEITRKNNLDLETKRYQAGVLVEETLFDNAGLAAQHNILYYANGRLSGQTTKNRDLQVASDTGYLYDAIGNITQLLTKSPTSGANIGYIEKHDYSYALWDSYLQETENITLVMTGCATIYRKITHIYDANGLLQKVENTLTPNNAVLYFSSNIEGVGGREDATGKTNYLTFVGNTIGDVRLNKDKTQHLEIYSGFTPEGNPMTVTPGMLFTTLKKQNKILNFLNNNTNSSPVSQIPNSTQDNLGAYTIKAGDTLESIAMQIYGDSSLWYLLADANGITDRAARAGEKGSQLHIGVRLNLPKTAKGQHQTNLTRNIVSNTEGSDASSNSVTFSPLIDTTPIITPAPPPHQTRSALSKIFSKIMVGVIGAVAMVMGAGALAVIVAGGSFAGLGLGGILSTGLSLLSGSAGLSMAPTLGISFAAGFVSSIAGQTAANVFSLQKGIDLKSALFSGLATAATAGVGRILSTSTAYKALSNVMDASPLNDVFSIKNATEMMTRDAVSQSLNLTLAQQQHFDWLELTSAAATAGVMGGQKIQGISSTINKKLGYAAPFINSELEAIATATTTGHFNALETIRQNLGNAVAATLFQQNTQASEIQEGAYCPIQTEEPDYCAIPLDLYETPIRTIAPQQVDIVDETPSVMAEYLNATMIPMGQGALLDFGGGGLFINNNEVSRQTIGQKDLLNQTSLPLVDALTDFELTDHNSLNQDQIKGIIMSKNPALVNDYNADEVIYKASQKYGINPKALLATLHQEQNWALNGRIAKAMGIGTEGNPESMKFEESVNAGAATYRKWFDIGEKYIAMNKSMVLKINTNFNYIPKTAAEYSRLKYTPWTYYSPQKSRPYDQWVTYVRTL